jgi:hypothetical protein
MNPRISTFLLSMLAKSVAAETIAFQVNARAGL